MTWDPSLEDIEARVEQLDAIMKDEDDYSFEEWTEEALERLLLQLATVRLCIRNRDWEIAINGAIDASHMCHKVAMNTFAQVPHEEILRFVKDKLEVLIQHPVAIAGETDMFVAFKLDHPTVPDTYEP